MNSLIWLVAAALSQDPPAEPAIPPPPAAAPSPESLLNPDAMPEDAPNVVKLRSLARKPYRIRVWWSFAKHPRITEALRAAVEEEVRSAASNHLGGAWILDFEPTPAAKGFFTPTDPEEELPKEAVVAEAAKGVDKVMWVEVGVAAEKAPTPPFVVAVREYDFEFKNWSACAKRRLHADDSLPKALFALVHRQFRANVAVVANEEERKRVRVVVRAQPFQPDDSDFPLLPQAVPIKLKRDVLKRGEKTGRADIQWTYLIYRSSEPDRTTALCTIMSALKAPIDTATLRRSRIMGIAASTSDDASTEVQFVTMQRAVKEGAEAGKRPVVGYEVLVRPQDQPLPLVLGNTDRRGKTLVRPSDLGENPTGDSIARVCEVTLRIGRLPVVAFPLVPGDDYRREIIASPDPMLPEVSGRVEALQAEIVDSMAADAIIKKRFKSKEEWVREQLKNPDKVTDADLKKWRAELEGLAAINNAIHDNEYFTNKVKAVRTEMEKLNKEVNKSTTLSKNSRNLFVGLERLLQAHEFGQKIIVKLSGKTVIDSGGSQPPADKGKPKDEGEKEKPKDEGDGEKK